jgi:hypothetical protein
LNPIRNIAKAISKTKFAGRALDEDPRGDPFKEKPSAKVLTGILLIAISYIIGWPMIGICGALALYWREPLLAVIGVPLLFVLAHLVFLAGVYLAGGKYFLPAIRWITRITLKKLT